MKAVGSRHQLFADLLWQGIRLPIFAILVVLEPAVTFLCLGIALLGVLTTVFFKLVAVPHFPFWTMLALSVAWVFVRMLYGGLLRLVAG